MHSLRAFFLFTAITANCYAEKISPESELPTPIGIAKATEISDGEFILSIAGRKIFTYQGPIYPEKFLHLKKSHYLIFSTDRLGARELPHFYIAKILKNKTSIFTNDEFYSPKQDDIEILTDKNTIKFQLGFERNKTKEAIFDGREIKIKYVTKSHIEKIPARLCKTSFDGLTWSCSTEQSNCDENTAINKHYMGARSAADMNAMDKIKNHPDFSINEWIGFCKKQCQSQVDYKEFKRKVCGIE